MVKRRKNENGCLASSRCVACCFTGMAGVFGCLTKNFRVSFCTSKNGEIARLARAWAWILCAGANPSAWR
jgi:hypothetical protein